MLSLVSNFMRRANTVVGVSTVKRSRVGTNIKICPSNRNKILKIFQP